MNQTIELTQDELALAILDLQNWRCPECEQGARAHYRQYPPRPQLGKMLVPCSGEYGLDFDSLPDPTREIAAAWELMKLAEAQYRREWCGPWTPWLIVARTQPGTDNRHGPHGYEVTFETDLLCPRAWHATIELAICLAWYELKTGVRVVLKASEEAL